MNTLRRFAVVGLVLVSSIVDARAIHSSTPDSFPNDRKLDVVYTQGPDPTPLPTSTPTKPPTRKPTKQPTPAPTIEVTVTYDTSVPTETPPPKCGTILKSDGSNLLNGPYSEDIPWNKDRFSNNTGTSHWYNKNFYWPGYMYRFRITQRCQYLYAAPETNNSLVELPNIDSWVEQAALKLRRPDNLGYKVSDDDVIFSGVPERSDIIRTDVANCPETYCVKVVGPAIINKSNNNDSPNPPELIYAFSHIQARNDFFLLLDTMARSKNKNKIFLTNHFHRCGSEPFCMDEKNPFDPVHVQATCYVEEKCGQRVFMVAYASDYPDELKPAWASTGTTEVMQWFDECAAAMYSCTEIPESDKSLFEGTRWNHWRYKEYPIVYKYDVYNNQTLVYGLGGDKYTGFPSKKHTTWPHVAWTCPSIDHRKQLEKFGEYVMEAELMRDSGIGLTVPDAPCEEVELIDPWVPNHTNPDPDAPSCADVEDHVMCYETPEGLCYAKTLGADCENVEFFWQKTSNSNTEIMQYDYWDMTIWFDDCLESIGCRKPPQWEHFNGNLTYRGRPTNYPHYSDGEWQHIMTNRKIEGRNTMNGKHKRAYYQCDNWESAYGARNFTDNAGNQNHKWGNEYGDLLYQRKCSESPSLAPSESPTQSHHPSGVPSLAPSLCGETYLTSESLNIALAIDLSFSTYEKEFSSTDPVGDLN